MNFEDVNYYEYDEDADGNEIYGKRATIVSSETSQGGLVWDNNGIVWLSRGAKWEEGGGAVANIITIDSIDAVYPVWVVTGQANNPILTNLTTGTSLTYNGNITPTQELRIDMRNKTATLNGANVLANIEGDWVSFSPGQNRVSYSTSNTDAPASTIEWQEIVG